MEFATVIGTMMNGYLLHRWAIDTWPELDALLFKDAGALTGALLGLATAVLARVGS